MAKKKIVFWGVFIAFFQPLCSRSLAEQYKLDGYREIVDETFGERVFDDLYKTFDQLIDFLQEDPAWAQKLYRAKECFIRSKEVDYYATDFFGFYDESEQEGRRQVAFYYSVHFHDFIILRHPELLEVAEINTFLKACEEIQKPYGRAFQEAAVELGIETLFSSKFGQPPILLKVVKYLPSYRPSRPHYDGTAFSLFLDSTDNESLLLAPYKSSYTVNDFFSPRRTFSRSDSQRSLLLIPGCLLTEYSIYPTPHIVRASNKTRYATIAFAMRPHYRQKKNECSALPLFS